MKGTESSVASREGLIIGGIRMKKKKMLFFILILLSSCIWLVGNMMMHDGALKTVYVPAKVPFQGVVGRNGVDKKKEGDGKSPTGIYSFGTAFGTVSRPTGIKMPYTVSTEHDYWIDDVNSLDYNKWVNYEGDPKERWASFERLKITPYKYSLVINYNTYDIVPGKGSAIFMHIESSSSKGTAGCINISEINMLKILKWLDPSKDPILIQGTKVYVESLAK